MSLHWLGRAALAAAVCAAPAFAQNQTDPEIAFNTGLTHLREGRIDMALEAFRRAVKQDPKNPYFHKGLGLALLRKADAEAVPATQRKRANDAIEEFRKALELNPYYVDVRNDLGTALVLAGSREEAKREFLKAFEDAMNPTPEISARNLGRASLEERNWPEAQRWFQTSVQRNAAYTDAHVGLVRALLAQNKLPEAIAHLEQAAKNAPDDQELALELGHAYYRAGRFTEARQRLERVAGKDPTGAAGRRASELLKGFPK